MLWDLYLKWISLVLKATLQLLIQLALNYEQFVTLTKHVSKSLIIYARSQNSYILLRYSALLQSDVIDKLLTLLFARSMYRKYIWIYFCRLEKQSVSVSNISLIPHNNVHGISKYHIFHFYVLETASSWCTPHTMLELSVTVINNIFQSTKLYYEEHNVCTFSILSYFNSHKPSNEFVTFGWFQNYP